MPARLRPASLSGSVDRGGRPRNGSHAAHGPLLCGPCGALLPPAPGRLQRNGCGARDPGVTRMNAHNPDTIQRLGEASQWLARLRDDPASEDNLRGWLRWCEQHPGNAEAFERIEGLWGQFGQVAQDFAADFVAQSQGLPTAPLRRPRHTLLWLAAASVL